ncbi:hypothetical protein [Streptomyces sp. NPDC048663]
MMVHGAAQGATRALTARLVDRVLSHPPDWVRPLLRVLAHLWEH